MAKEPEVKADPFALEVDGKQQYPQIVGQKIENNKVVAGVVVKSPEEHKKWMEENSGKPSKDDNTPDWGKK